MESLVPTKKIRLFGIVQGVGFRPFVSRIADRCGVRGSVANKGSYVEVFAQAPPESLATFLTALANETPERSVVLKTEVSDCRRPTYDAFEIIESEKEAGDIFVSPDIATCDKCKSELFDPSDRRFLHPFINCTACGPRLTILDAMPYDRVRTSMGEFPMCPQCAWEYTHAETRRYDAQPVCCNDCGPQVYLLEKPGAVADSSLADNLHTVPTNEYLPKNSNTDPATFVHGKDAILAARAALAEGKIVAIKGIGGFHLACDATNEAAVARLRKLKRRPMKPFAVMARDLEAVRRECVLDKCMEAELDNHQKPILLLPRRTGGKLAPSVAPDNPNVGVMLPYAPVQMLLFDYPASEVSEQRATAGNTGNAGRKYFSTKLTENQENSFGRFLPTDCLVMTSGNVSGAPICRTDEDALAEIAEFADLILSHNRTIRLRADDSVMDFYRGKPYMIRRSRGYAPLPFWMPTEISASCSVLAIGGELKNTFCVGKGQLLYPSPYVGDMEDIRTVEALRASIRRMCELLEAKPEIVACDLHPKYNTSAVAREFGLPVLEIQHHYAHILSCMAENAFGKPVIGVSFDGTGYGADGTIWGGEFMIADLHGYKRVGSIFPFPQAGGDASAKEGWRIAMSMINRLYTKEEALSIAKELELCSPMEAALNRQMIEKRINSVNSTSAGRLFDAVSAVLGIRRRSTYEGEASMTLQFRAEAWEREHPSLRDTPGTPATCSSVVPSEAIMVPGEELFHLPTNHLFREIL
ncbi:MAG: carbamoyltransferase HypF, partial [bacterium]